MTWKPSSAVAPVAALLLAVATGCGGSQPGAPVVTAPTSGPPAGPATGQAEPASAPPTAFSVPVGSVLTFTDNDGATAKATARSVKPFTKACKAGGDNPEHGRYIVVDLLVEQITGDGNVGLDQFEFVADDGTTAAALGATLSGCDNPQLDSAQLHGGQKRAGKVIFDTPAKSGTVEWSPRASSVGSWKFTG